jgi:hypothetical protein
MNKTTISRTALGALLVASAFAAQAQIRITEVAPWGSGNSPYAADWFELTNTGSSAVNISGWKFDDDSASFGSAVALNGITSIAAGESVIFMETSSPSTISSFLSTWFGANVPAGLQVGMYSGSGVGLSANADQVNIFDASGVLQAKVIFGASDSTSPYQSFDNSAGANNVTITLLSAIGTNGAHAAANDATEIGSPGVVAAVPEPSSYALLIGGLGLVGFVARRRGIKG